MNAHNFANLGNYLSEFLRSLDTQVASKGSSAYAVQVLSDGIDEQDIALLQ